MESEKNEIEIEKLNKRKQLADQAYEVLLDLEKKNKYLHVLFLFFSCSQPLTIDKLVNDYNFQVFPYFTFQIYNPKMSTEDYFDQSILVLDYINFNIVTYKRQEMAKLIIMDIVEVN